MWTIFIFKVFIEFVTILLLLFMFCFLPWGMGILAPQPGIEPTPPALEGEVLTTEQPGKLLTIIFEWWTLMVIENDLSIPDA